MELNGDLLMYMNIPVKNRTINHFVEENVYIIS